MRAADQRKVSYRALCDAERSIPIFNRDWWLDAVTAGRWDVALVEKGGRIVAAMPYAMRRRCGFLFIEQPALTQFNGPWIAPDRAWGKKRLGAEKGNCPATPT